MAEKEVKLFSNNFMAAAFALANLLLVLLLMWTMTTEYAPEWKKYQREYYRLWAAKLTGLISKVILLSSRSCFRDLWR